MIDDEELEEIAAEINEEYVSGVNQDAGEDVDISSDSDDSSYKEMPPLTSGSARPVKGEAFCDCYKTGKEKDCVCGEDDMFFEWKWDSSSKSVASFLKHDQREVVFHVDYSCGTAAVRGSAPMLEDQYYWEVKMTTPVYGTDMMVGVGTMEMDLNKYRHKFCSLIGRDAESWGLSYTGMLHHKGHKEQYSSKFGQGTIIGVHLDMWHGTLSFYKNRKPLGVAYTGLQGKKLYPLVSSTAARSGMKVIKCRSFKTSLQFMCCQILRTVIPRHLDVLEVIDMPPGLKEFLENNISWLMKPCTPEPQGPTLTEILQEQRGKKRRRSQEDDDCGPSTSKHAR